MQRPVFVVISRTDTAIPKRDENGYYNHAAISFSKGLDVMYSFSRYRVNAPYVGGFVAEKPSRYMSGDEPTPIKLFLLMADEDDYKRIRERVDGFSRDRGHTVYNHFGAAATVDGAYTDVQFVTSVLEIKNVRTISHLERELEFCRVYTGTMQKYLNTEYECDDLYFTRESAPKVVFSTIAQLATLAKRRLFGNKNAKKRKGEKR